MQGRQWHRHIYNANIFFLLALEIHYSPVPQSESDFFGAIHQSQRRISPSCTSEPRFPDIHYKHNTAPTIERWSKFKQAWQLQMWPCESMQYLGYKGNYELWGAWVGINLNLNNHAYTNPINAHLFDRVFGSMNPLVLQSVYGPLIFCPSSMHVPWILFPNCIQHWKTNPKDSFYCV